jgi:hypothetical protein
VGGCARFAQSVCRTCAVRRAEVGIRGEIVLRFQRAGFDVDAVGGSGFQWFGPRIFEGGLHAANAFAVGKHFYRGGIRIGFEFPRGKGIFVAFQGAYGNHFKRSQLKRGSEREIDVAKPSVVSDGQDPGFEPIAEMNNINSGENNRESDENPSFFIHMPLNGAAISAVEPSIQTR